MPAQNPSTAATRFSLIDWLRAIAIGLMVIYHFAFDLQNLQLISATSFYGPAMTAIGRSCLGLFMFCAGYSLALAHAEKIRWKNFGRRWLKIAGAAALVSVATYLTYPDYWIFFGILHCMAFTSLLLLPFLRLPRVSLAIGLGMLVAYAGFHINAPFPGHNHPSLDFIPPWPWSWSAFIGITACHYRLHERIRPPAQRLVELASRHSLVIYLIHQPILMGIAYGIWHLYQ